MNSKNKNSKFRIEPILGEPKNIEIEDVAHDAIKIDKNHNTKPDKRLSSTMDYGIKKSSIIISAILLLSLSVFAADLLLNPKSFEIEELRISAEFKEIDPVELRKSIMPHLQKNYFALDLASIKSKTEKHPWVDQVSVRRQWPKSILIRLTEQKLVATWDKNKYLNTRGEVVEINDPSAEGGLPVLSGPEGSEKQVLANYFKWKAILKEVGFSLDTIILSPHYSYEALITLNSDQLLAYKSLTLSSASFQMDQQQNGFNFKPVKTQLILKLGKRYLERRLVRFTENYSHVLNENLFKVALIDLRYQNGFAVRWKDPTMTKKMTQLASITKNNSME